MTITEAKLANIESFLERIESKLDNFMGFEGLPDDELGELVKIKSEMDKGLVSSYEDVFDN